MERTRKIGVRAYIMLLALRHTGRALTRKELLTLVRPEGRSTTWGNSYFTRSRWANGHGASLLLRGWVKCIGKGRSGFLYELTESGIALLDSMDENAGRYLIQRGL